MILIKYCKAHVLRSFKGKMPKHARVQSFSFGSSKKIMSIPTYTEFKTHLSLLLTVGLATDTCKCVKNALNILNIH